MQFSQSALPSNVSSVSCTILRIVIRTVLFAHVSVVFWRSTPDNSSGMPQPRPTRRPGSGEVSQAQVLSDPANGEERHGNEYDKIQAPWAISEQ